jgi:hypothetical protein
MSHLLTIDSPNKLRGCPLRILIRLKKKIKEYVVVSWCQQNRLLALTQMFPQRMSINLAAKLLLKPVSLSFIFQA